MIDENTITIEQVSTYSPEVVDEIRNLTKQLDTEYQDLTEEDARYMLSSDNTHVYIARDRQTQKAVGMYTLIVYRIPYKMKAQLEDLVVDPSYRGRGLGTKLMEHAVSEAHKYKIKSLNFTSRPTRESANKLYSKLGFEKRETNVYRKEL